MLNTVHIHKTFRCLPHISCIFYKLYTLSDTDICEAVSTRHADRSTQSTAQRDVAGSVQSTYENGVIATIVESESKAGGRAASSDNALRVAVC